MKITSANFQIPSICLPPYVFGYWVHILQNCPFLLCSIKILHKIMCAVQCKVIKILAFYFWGKIRVSTLWGKVFSPCGTGWLCSSEQECTENSFDQFETSVIKLIIKSNLILCGFVFMLYSQTTKPEIKHLYLLFHSIDSSIDVQINTIIRQ